MTGGDVSEAVSCGVSTGCGGRTAVANVDARGTFACAASGGRGVGSRG
jgi:hypothetical protein